MREIRIQVVDECDYFDYLFGKLTVILDMVVEDDDWSIEEIGE